ncbi:peptide/nickel transport system substrate-binding protein [Halogranum gelatinilyticum]|uniref:Peptide/nickel transport system substrate-binding protein n=1 Tax=Halogranum gelatinilyticum TaxID=660521 RepID=A0A1H0AEK5_9EURY|nr:ABC transporter substrate-binding protein [Halogranum gelatinilyticum]SDN31206.1 peptide/nickel transport system substrate-binding protein [Halogranum gelatinilyticum]
MSRDSNSSSSETDSSGAPTLDRRKFLAATAAGVPVALAGCTGGDGGSDTETSGDGGSGDGGSTESGSSGEASSGGTLQWGGAVPVQGLDPHLDSAAASSRVLENITEPLIQLDFDYSLNPHLAKEWTTSEDNTTLTFTLEEGVTFHNGKEMTSADVLASFERIANGEYLATGFFDFVDSMEAPGDYEFVINLSEPFAPFLARMATSEMHVLPEEQAQEDKITEPIGTGPYQFASREIETSFTMEKYEDYWDQDEEDGPFLDKIVKSEITDPSVRLQSFRAGEYDFINGIPPKDVQSVQNDSSVRFETQFPKALVYLGLNCNEEPFDNKDARLALDYALDKEQITEAALYGTGQATASPAAPGSPWVNEDVEPRPRDLDKAQEHLEKAGMPDGFEVSFKIPQSYPTQVQGAKVIADQASDAGITMNIQQITWSTWLSDVYTNQNFQATTSSYLALYYPDVSFYKFLHPNGAFFFTGWENEEYNELVEEARRLYDEEQRAELYHEATEILQEERAGHLLLWWQPNLYGSSTDYKGRIGAPDGSTLRFRDNYLE